MLEHHTVSIQFHALIFDVLCPIFIFYLETYTNTLGLLFNIVCSEPVSVTSLNESLRLRCSRFCIGEARDPEPEPEPRPEISRDTLTLDNSYFCKVHPLLEFLISVH